MNNNWVDITGYDGRYQVNMDGIVRSMYYPTTSGIKIRLTPKIMATKVTTDGYFRITLCKDYVYTCYSIHRLIALHFIPNPDNKPQINHIDGNKFNNKIENLEWSNKSENALHAYRIGLRRHTQGEDATYVKLTNEIVIDIFSSEMAALAIANKYNISRSSVYGIRKRRTWTTITNSL